jgi:hypothetical protein
MSFVNTSQPDIKQIPACFLPRSFARGRDPTWTNRPVHVGLFQQHKRRRQKEKKAGANPATTAIPMQAPSATMAIWLAISQLAWTFAFRSRGSNPSLVQQSRNHAAPYTHNDSTRDMGSTSKFMISCTKKPLVRQRALR